MDKILVIEEFSSLRELSIYLQEPAKKICELILDKDIEDYIFDLLCSFFPAGITLTTLNRFFEKECVEVLKTNYFADLFRDSSSQLKRKIYEGETADNQLERLEEQQYW